MCNCLLHLVYYFYNTLITAKELRDMSKRLASIEEETNSEIRSIDASLRNRFAKGEYDLNRQLSVGAQQVLLENGYSLRKSYQWSANNPMFEITFNDEKNAGKYLKSYHDIVHNPSDYDYGDDEDEYESDEEDDDETK